MLKDIVVGAEGHLLDQRVRARLVASSRLSLQQAATLYQKRGELIDDATWELAGKVVAIPTVKHVAPTLSEVQNEETFAQVNLQTLSLTMIGSFLDMPGIAIPTGTDGLAGNTSALLSAPRGEDSRLLRAAARIERIINHQETYQ